MSATGILIRGFKHPKILITVVLTTLMFCLLLWQHFHGGVEQHHILQRSDLPQISNWWGGILIPVLTWILLGRIETRIQKNARQENNINPLRPVIQLFWAGLAIAIILVVSFTNHYTSFLENIPYFILILSLFIPIYNAEFILGFVLGMTITFGAILPTVFVLILAGVGFLIYRFIRPIFVRIINLLKGNR